MRGIRLKDVAPVLGYWDGFKFWFRWGFVCPIKQFIWLNITHKPYCTYSGWHCDKKNCSHKHLLTKKEIKEQWAENKKEIETVEKGPNGECVYCYKEKGEIEIENPNFDKLSRWLVCKNCAEVIKYQQKGIAGQIIGDSRLIEEAHNKLLEISQKTGIPIMTATISKQGFDSIVYGGDDEEKI